MAQDDQQVPQPPRAGAASPPRTTASGPGALTDVQRDNAKQRHHKYTTAQVARKAVAAVVGLVATAGGVAPSTSAGPPQPPAHAFPAYINNGSCGLEGGTASGKPVKADDAERNELKNRSVAPAGGQIADAVTIDDFVSPAKDVQEKSGTLSEEMGATVTGYIVKIVSGGAETCNCQTNDKTFWDTHIYLSKDDPRTRQQKDGYSETHADMIAEITPRMRQILHPGAKDWDTDTLAQRFPKGTKVTVTGWQFYDKEHENQAYALHQQPKNWRYSCWEIHPVTEISEAK